MPPGTGPSLSPTERAKSGAAAERPPRALGGASLLKKCRLYGVDWWTSSTPIGLYELSPHLGYASWRSYNCIAVPRHSVRSVYASRGGRSITVSQQYVRTRFCVTADAVSWNGIGLPMTHVMGYGY